MDRLLVIEPRNLILTLELGKKYFATIQLKNVMHTMPVAFFVQVSAPKRYTIKPEHGIIAPLEAASVMITVNPQAEIPLSIPFSDDKFIVKSVVVPGGSEYNPVLLDWFTGNKKHVYCDHALRVFFVGGGILIKLVGAGRMEDVRQVLELSEKLVDSTDEFGSAALHIAIRKRRPELVQLLLEFRANVNVTNGMGQTALQQAAVQGETLIVELLLARGVNVNARALLGHTALQMAVIEDHSEVAKLLVENGADVHGLTVDGKTLLHLAVDKARYGCMELLLQMGADPNGRHKDDGNTPLHWAIQRADKKAMEVLLKHGACKELKNKIGRTPGDLARERGLAFLEELVLGDRLQRASRKGNLIDLKEILRSGVAVGVQDGHKWTALHTAAFKGHMGVVRTLLAAGTNLEDVDDVGYTPLHCAVEAGNKDIVKLLLKHGAPTNACTHSGSTALDLAIMFKYPGIATLVLECGGCSNKRSKDVNTKPIFPMKKEYSCQIFEKGDKSSRQVQCVNDSFGDSLVTPSRKYFPALTKSRVITYAVQSC